MLIGVISDTHDRLPKFAAAVDLLKQRDVAALLHAGDYVAPFAAKLIGADAMDVPVHCIFGNNDGEREGLKRALPQIVDGPVRLELGGCSIAMAHFIDWFAPGDLDGADVVISGHTHAVVNEPRDGVLYLNPGECCGWLTGTCTVAVLDTETRAAEIVTVPS